MIVGIDNKNNEMSNTKVSFNMEYPVYYYEQKIYEEDSSSDEEVGVVNENSCKKFSNMVNKMMLFLSLLIFSYGIINIIFEMLQVNFMNFYVDMLIFIDNLFYNKIFIGFSLISFIFLTLYFYKKMMNNL